MYFKIRNININIEENLFLSISQINALRRNAFEEYSKYILQKDKHSIDKIHLKNFDSTFQSTNKSISLCIKFLNNDITKIIDKIDELYVPLKEVISKTELFSSLNCKKYILLPTITKAKYNNLIKNNISKLQN